MLLPLSYALKETAVVLVVKSSAGCWLSFAFCSSPSVCAALSDFIRIEEIKAAATLSRRFSPDSSSLNDLHIFDNILQQIQQKQYRKKDAQKKTEEKTLKEKQEAEKRHREEQKKREDEKRRQEKEKELNKKRAKMCMQGNRWRDY
ncbi:hypothetical protein TYRP_012179 [Tyrophagus putrescentiae]|nr:hypothetical protein TYRP_012179 [Tyrophagus putrescentiae]